MFAADIGNCGTLSSPGTYALTRDVSANGICFNITSADVVLDCQGHTLTGNGMANIDAIYSAGKNSTIRNCVISNFGNGIKLDAVGARIEGTKITTVYPNSNGYGVWAKAGNATIFQSNILATGSSSTGTVGSVTIDSSNVTSNSATAVSSPLLVTNSIIRGWQPGIQLSGCGATVKNSQITSDNMAIIMGGCNNTIANNTIITTTLNSPLYYYALQVFQGKEGNVIYNNTFISTSGAATLVSVTASSPPLLYWNNFTRTSGYYIYTNTGEYQTVYLNTSINGQQEGNVYDNVMTGNVSITGNSPSQGYPNLYVGAAGSGYPYNTQTSGGKIIGWMNGYVVDYAPLARPTQAQLGNLIVSASPASSGMTMGTAYNFTVPATKPMNASAAANYLFSNWSLTGNCTIANASEANTTVTVIGGTCYATANFVPVPLGNLIVNVSPANGGNATGTAYNVQVPFTRTVTSTPNPGYTWGTTTLSTSGNCSIGTQTFVNGTPQMYMWNVTVYSGTCNATTYFVPIPTGNLIVNVSPANAGFAGPTMYNFTVPATIPIMSYQTAPSNYTFANWSKSGNCTLANASTGNTSVTIYSGTCYVTANFIYTPPVPQGCVCGTPLNTPNYVCNVTQDLASNETCFNVTASNVTIQCNGHLLSGNNATIAITHGIYSNSSRTKVLNCRIRDFYDQVYFLGADSGLIDNLTANEWGHNIVEMVSSSNNVIRNSNVFTYWSGGIVLRSFSHGNVVSNVTANSEGGTGVIIEFNAYNNTVANCTMSGNEALAIFDHSNGNTAYGNVLHPSTIATPLELLQIYNSSGNSIYWNSFTATPGAYINDTDGGNFYNTTMGRHSEGNIYADVLDHSVSVWGSMSSLYPGSPSSFPLYVGSGGAGYPYNAANSQGKVIGNATDYAPLTYTNTIPPAPAACACGIALSTPNYVCNVTSDLYTNGTCFSVNATNVTIQCNGHTITNTAPAPDTEISGVKSNQLRTSVLNCNIRDFGTQVYLGDASFGLIDNVVATTSKDNSYGMQLASTNNSTVKNSVATVEAGTHGGTAVWLDLSKNNTITNVSMTSYFTTPMILVEYANNNTVANCRFSGIDGRGVYLSMYSGNNKFYMNTFDTVLGNAQAGVFIDAGSNGNVFYWNNFVSTAHYAYDKGVNFFNTTINGQPEGNIYANVMSGAVQVNGTVASSGFPQLYAGTGGSGYPYNAANSQGGMLINAVDYAPLTPYLAQPLLFGGNNTANGTMANISNASSVQAKPGPKVLPRLNATAIAKDIIGRTGAGQVGGVSQIIAKIGGSTGRTDAGTGKIVPQSGPDSAPPAGSEDQGEAAGSGKESAPMENAIGNIIDGANGGASMNSFATGKGQQLGDQFGKIMDKLTFKPSAPSGGATGHDAVANVNSLLDYLLGLK